MGEDFIVNLLGNIGVPAAVCFYTLYRVNDTLKELTNAINRQTAEIERREAAHTHEIAELSNKVLELTFKLENMSRKE